MKQIKIIIVLVSIFLLSNCGYHLAGKAELDPIFENTHVAYQNNGRRVAELLEKQFEVNGVNLVATEKASVLVNVLYEVTNREVLSLDEEGKVREYELILRTAVDVRDTEGKLLIKGSEIRLTRDFLFDIDEVLGKANEEQQIYQEMREDVARLIIYRLQAISSEELEGNESKS